MRDTLKIAAEDLHPPHATPGLRVGLLGGSFNPPHAAHKLISSIALKRLRLAQVWWMVSPGNPLKDRSELAPLAERVRLCREASASAQIKVTAFEASLHTSYTASTLGFLVQRMPLVKFVWLMGADNLASFHRWRDWQSIFRLMPIAVADRPHMRYRALSSPAASRFARSRVPEKLAGLLPDMTPPAWCYLSGPLSDLSSTAIRRGKRVAARPERRI
jgi:nicotinate-nucleotide adenylyltransferase